MIFLFGYFLFCDIHLKGLKIVFLNQQKVKGEYMNDYKDHLIRFLNGRRQQVRCDPWADFIVFLSVCYFNDTFLSHLSVPSFIRTAIFFILSVISYLYTISIVDSFI